MLVSRGSSPGRNGKFSSRLQFRSRGRQLIGVTLHGAFSSGACTIAPAAILALKLERFTHPCLERFPFLSNLKPV